MERYAKPLCGFNILGDRIKTDCTVRRKVTGTRFGSILGASPWASQFATACDLMGLADRDISAKSAVHTGTVLEPVIIDYAGRTYSEIGEFVPARDVFGEKVGSHDEWAQDFEDPVFGGHVDGFVSRNGTDYILEVKTARDITSWRDSVPPHYYWQVALYNHFLTGQDRAYFLLGIVDEGDYADPHSWVPTPDNCLLFEVPIDREAVARRVQEVRDWYAEYIDTGTTPPWDPDNRRDMELVEHLRSISAGSDSLAVLLDRYAELMDEIDRHNAVIADKVSEAEAIKDSLKDAMVTNGTGELTSSSGDWTAVITVSKRTTWDESLMKKDGIDIGKYRNITESNTFRLKPVKKKV